MNWIMNPSAGIDQIPFPLIWKKCLMEDVFEICPRDYHRDYLITLYIWLLNNITWIINLYWSTTMQHVLTPYLLFVVVILNWSLVWIQMSTKVLSSIHIGRWSCFAGNRHTAITKFYGHTMSHRNNIMFLIVLVCLNNGYAMSLDLNP